MKTSLQFCAAMVLAMTVATCGPRAQISDDAKSVLAGKSRAEAMAMVVPPSDARKTTRSLEKYCIANLGRPEAAVAAATADGYLKLAERSDGVTLYFEPGGSPTLALGGIPGVSAPGEQDLCMVLTRETPSMTKDLARYVVRKRGGAKIPFTSTPEGVSVWNSDRPAPSLYVLAERDIKGVGPSILLGVAAE